MEFSTALHIEELGVAGININLGYPNYEESGEERKQAQRWYVIDYRHKETAARVSASHLKAFQSNIVTIPSQLDALLKELMGADQLNTVHTHLFLSPSLLKKHQVCYLFVFSLKYFVFTILADSLWDYRSISR